MAVKIPARGEQRNHACHKMATENSPRNAAARRNHACCYGSSQSPGKRPARKTKVV